jgi:NTE family protein
MGEPADMVFEGGGVKGIGLAGAYRELFDNGYAPRCVAGTSAGAITAALVAAGYDGEELEEIVLHEMHFPDFADRPRLHVLGPLGSAIDVLRELGLHSGDYFHKWIADRLAAKGITTFKDLRIEQPENDKRLYRLKVIASDLTDYAMLVLPDDAEKLGVAPDELSVADAVRMSMSIPVFFDPVLRDDAGGRRHMIVDGGMLSNYPVWLFDAPGGQEPRFPTFGFLLVAPNQRNPLLPHPLPAAPHDNGMPSPTGYVKMLADTMMEAHDRFYVEQENFVRTIAIPTCGVTTTEFDIAEAKAKELFESGRNAAKSFLSTWDFDKYKAQYRAGPSPTRREETLA